MTPAVRVGLFGLGRAGKAVATQLMSDPAIKLEWIVRNSTQNEESAAEQGVPVYGEGVDLETLVGASPVDFAVDFSVADACLRYAPIMAKRKVGIISAVSSYEPQHLSCLETASQNTVVLHSPNITLGINFIMIAGRILRQVAPHVEAEVVEEHFREKLDISGTAIRIAELLDLDSSKQIKSVRVGGIIGRHEIIFGFPFQTVRLIHDSISREAFGQGVLYALNKLYGGRAGFYTMEQLVAEDFRAALA